LEASQVGIGIGVQRCHPEPLVVAVEIVSSGVPTRADAVNHVAQKVVQPSGVGGASRELFYPVDLGPGERSTNDVAFLRAIIDSLGRLDLGSTQTILRFARWLAEKFGRV